MTDVMQQEPAQGARIFISYSRKDSQFVDRLARALSERGYEILLDREDISGGEAWKERLDALILQADAVVFVLSPDSLASTICGWETQRTVELGKRLVPLCWRRTDDAAAPEQLARLNYIFADEEEKFDDAVARVSAACDVDIAWVREHTRLVELASRWHGDARKESALLRADALDAAEAWLSRRQPRAPDVPETLTAYLQAARAAETVAREKERKSLRRMRSLQLGVGSLVAVAAVVVAIAGVGAARLISGLGAQRATALMELAKTASDAGLYDRAARYALAGMHGADWPLIGFDASGAEAELRRAVAASRSAGVLLRHEGALWDAAFSADGTRIVTASEDGTARVWDAVSGRELAVLRGHDGAVKSAAFSADGARIITTSDQGDVHLWDAVSGRGITVLSATAYIYHAAFSSDGARLVTASDDGVPRIWSSADGSELAALPGHQRAILSAAFSADGTRLVTTSYDRTARVWDIASGLEVAVFAGHERVVQDAAFSPNGTRVVTVSDERVARVFNVASGAEIVTLSGHEGPVRSAAFSPDGARIVTVSDDRTARVWDAANGREIAVMRGHNGPVRSAVFSASGAQLLTRASDDSARLWDVVTGSQIAALRGHEGDVRSAAFSADNRRIVTTSEDGTARVWETQNIREVMRLSPEQGVFNAAFSADGTRLRTFAPGIARVWDISSGQEVASFPAPPGGASYFSGDGTRVVTWDGTLRVSEVATGREIATMLGHESDISSAVFDAREARVASASHDNTARVWDAASGRQLAVLRGHEDFVLSVQFSIDGARIVTASTDGTARVWDVASGRVLAVMRGHEGAAFSAAFNPDATRVVTTGDDGTVRVWDAANGEEIVVLRGHAGAVNSAVFSSNGAHVVSLMAHDGSVRMWDVASGREIGALQSPFGYFSYSPTYALTGDGTRIALTSGIGSAHVLALHPALSASRTELRALACSTRLNGELGRFSESDYRAAPVLDRSLDTNACIPPSLWTRLGVYLGFAPRRAR